MAGNSWIDVYWEMSVDPNYLGESDEDTTPSASKVCSDLYS